MTANAGVRFSDAIEGAVVDIAEVAKRLNAIDGRIYALAFLFVSDGNQTAHIRALICNALGPDVLVGIVPDGDNVVSETAVQKDDNSNIAMLSAREHEILNNLELGYRYKEVAERMFISIETVRTHVRNVYQKLQVRNRTEALRMLRR